MTSFGSLSDTSPLLRGIVFDLDLTLIDSGPAEALRAQRKWASVYELIPRLTPYPGVDELLSFLKKTGIGTAIVTSAPKSYCSRVVDHWGWQIDYMVCYHDTIRKKPHPEPILRFLELSGLEPTEVISVGDDPGDVVMAMKAGVRVIGASWGTKSVRALRESGPEAICATPEQLRILIQGELSRGGGC
jgi:HAD superfamily hydrolase (TIGR01549 family)